MNMLRMTPEQVQAHNARIGSARLVKGRDTKGEPMGPKSTRVRKPSKKPRRQVAIRESEASVLKACQRILESHPKVAGWWRCNSGGIKKENGTYVKFAFSGASDLMGFTTGTARFIAVECKATGKRATEDQRAFLDNVNDAGGLGICVDHPGKLALALMAL